MVILKPVQPLTSTPRKKVLPSYHFLGNNYSPSTYSLVNKYSLQEISTPLEIVWSVAFSHLSTPGSSIFLGNMYSLVKPFYWNKRKQRLRGVSLNRCSLKFKQNSLKIPVKKFMIMFIFAKIENCFFIFLKFKNCYFQGTTFFFWMNVRMYLK